MWYRRAADVVAVSHLSLIGFLLAGGFVARRHPRVTKAHLVALAATAGIYGGGFDCPLTDWEKGLRRLAGDEVYAGGYLEHYLVAPCHPAGMNPAIGFGHPGRGRRPPPSSPTATASRPGRGRPSRSWA